MINVIKKQRGVTLLELLVAMIVLMIGLFVVFNIFPRAFSIAYKARAREIAYHLAQTKIERTFAYQVYLTTATSPSTSTTLANEFYDNTFNGYGWNGSANVASTSNATAAERATDDNSPDSIFTIDASKLNSVSNTDYKPFESTYYGSVTGYDRYFYRPEIANISDPHLLYLDNVTRRLTIYVVTPPALPYKSSFDEKGEMEQGNIVVVSAIRTNRSISASISQAAAAGDMRIYVNSKEDSYKFPIFNVSGDGETTTKIRPSASSSGYLADLDYTSAYTKEYSTSYFSAPVTYGEGNLKGRAVYYATGASTYSYPMNIVSATSSPDTNYLFNYVTASHTSIGGCADPANFCAVVGTMSSSTCEPIQITGRDYDSTLGYYYLVLGNPLKNAHTTSEKIYAWIYFMGCKQY